MRIIAARGEAGRCKTSGSPRSAGTDAREATFQDEARKSVVAPYSLRAKGPLLNDVPSISPLFSHRLDLLWAVAGAEHCVSALFYAAIV
ncbi:MAG: hypothetical protein QOH35_1933 [Acidobacteriaceae bacterium]|jgi:hypothetical protein|nr:hypothetical protein [Acidobacteriaceae bacterium]MDX6464822.1 hypothetical protein [Acidobacteriaceae bacterium]MEA2260037.1 hypothetical protein [Acidobacteriaceae bacterium]MEA2540567.1 hypothetical protein [Acidobacteriaceae bacterium]